MGNTNPKGQKGANVISSVLADPDNDAKVRAAFKFLDKDGSGALDKKEWKIFATSLFQNQDIKGADVASAALQNPGSLDNFITQLFCEVDLNNDGQVSFLEFEQWLQCLQADLKEEQGPPGPHQSPVFTVPLDQMTDGVKVPYIWESIFAALSDPKVVEIEGILRIPGSTHDIHEYKKQFDLGREVDLQALKIHCHDTVGILKMYIRELPEPVIPVFLSNQVTPSASVDDIKMLMTCVPKPNLLFFTMLIKCLHKIVEYPDNKMTMENVTRCIVPTLGCSPIIVSTCLGNINTIFP